MSCIFNGPLKKKNTQTIHFPTSSALAEPALLGKVLFQNDYTIVEDYGSLLLSYNTSGDRFIFYFRDKNIGSEGKMELDLRNQSQVGFAIDYYRTEPDLDGFCQKNSSEQLSNLMDSCHRAALRSLTEGERKQLKTYKSEQEGRPSSFSFALKLTLNCNLNG